MAVQIDVVEAGAKLPGLLERARAGEDVVIAEAGKRPVRLIAVEQVPAAEAAKRNRRLGTARGLFTVPDDFNDPLPDHVLAEFEK